MKSLITIITLLVSLTSLAQVFPLETSFSTKNKLSIQLKFEKNVLKKYTIEIVKQNRVLETKKIRFTNSWDLNLDNNSNYIVKIKSKKTVVRTLCLSANNKFSNLCENNTYLVAINLKFGNEMEELYKHLSSSRIILNNNFAKVEDQLLNLTLNNN